MRRTMIGLALFVLGVGIGTGTGIAIGLERGKRDSDYWKYMLAGAEADNKRLFAEILESNDLFIQDKREGLELLKTIIDPAPDK